MSIISGPVTQVSHTKFLTSVVKAAKLVRENDHGKIRTVKKPVPNSRPLQLVIFSNAVKVNPKSSDHVHIILPFPKTNGTNRFSFLDLSKYSTLFGDAEKLFMKLKMDFDGDYPNMKTKFKKGTADYAATNYFKLSELLASPKYELSNEIKASLRQYYSKEYGFVVLSLRKTARYRPIAYVHEIRADGKLYIPGRHIQSHIKGNPFNNDYDIYSEDQGTATDAAEAEVHNFMTETMGMEDPYIRHKTKKANLNAFRDDPVIGWDHCIYVINQPRIEKNHALKKPGIEIKSADSGRIYRFHDTFKPRKIPKVLLPRVTDVHCVNVFNGYKYNHDLLL